MFEIHVKVVWRNSGKKCTKFSLLGVRKPDVLENPSTFVVKGDKFLLLTNFVYL